MDTEVTTEVVAETTTNLIQEGINSISNLPTTTDEADEYVRNLIKLLEEFAVTYGGKLIIALLILVVGFKIVNVCSKKIAGSKAFSQVENSTKNFIKSLFSIVLKVIIGMTALAIMGIPMSSMVAVIGSCGLAIGLALQGSLSNIAGGFILLLLKPFSVGDFITSGEISGTVEEIGIFHTRVITIDNRRIIVPNSTISNATLVNVTAMKERRVDLTFTAAYNADIDLVEKTLVEVCKKHEKVLENPEPFARLSAHKDSALEYTVRAWCKTENYWDVYFDLQKMVKRAFDEKGIEIPFPQIVVNSAENK